VSPVRYELGFYFPEDAILHIDRREHLKSYTATAEAQAVSAVYANSHTAFKWSVCACAE
jgi:hypothetical protein